MTFSAPLSQTELNKVFVQRDKRGGYTPINNANKLILLEEFKKVSIKTVNSAKDKLFLKFYRILIQIS